MTAGDDASSLIRVECRFQGRVQGVGFRYTTASIARRYAVAGYVMNCADGSVELVVEGERTEVTRFIDDVQKTFSKNIHDCRQSESAACGEFADFRIRRG
ncbi:MAG: acylphosphatase [Planctomycetaceae bacterium]